LEYQILRVEAERQLREKNDELEAQTREITMSFDEVGNPH